MTDTSLSPETEESFLWLAEQKHDGFLVALWLDPAQASQIAVSPGEPADNLHVTLAYCGSYEEIEELAQARVISAIYDVVRYDSALEGSIAGYGRFVASETSDGKDVFYLTPDVPRLFDLRQRIIECLRCNGLTVSEAHGYTPHITLAYLPSNQANPKYDVPEVDLKFMGVTVMAGTRRVEIPFWVPEAEPTISMSENGELPLDAPLGTNPARALYFGSFDKEWIPFLPKPGTYNHEVFGEMDLTSTAYDQMLDNFNSYVYKQDLPIRATHTPAEAGAVGWIKPGGMRLAEDGSLEVKPEWNELGKGLVEDDRFKYVSAEFVRTWKNPVTQELHDNVAIGLALVTRPHFKTDVLNPLSYSEAIAFGEFTEREVAETTEPSTESQEEPEMTEPVVTPTEETVETPAAVADPITATMVAATGVPATPAPLAEVTLSDLTQVVLTAEQRNKERLMFSDLTARVELAERRATTAEAEVKRVAGERRVEKFTAEVIGRSAENGDAWFGNPQDNVAHLVSLSETYGDESPEVKWAVTQKRNEAKAIRATGLFDPIALGAQEEGASITAQVTFLAEQYRSADPSLTLEKAISKAYDEHPDLYIKSLNVKK